MSQCWLDEDPHGPRVFSCAQANLPASDTGRADGRLTARFPRLPDAPPHVGNCLGSVIFAGLNRSSSFSLVSQPFCSTRSYTLPPVFRASLAIDADFS